MIEPRDQGDWKVQLHNDCRGRVVAQAVARLAWEPVGERAEQSEESSS